MLLDRTKQRNLNYGLFVLLCKWLTLMKALTHMSSFDAFPKSSDSKSWTSNMLNLFCESSKDPIVCAFSSCSSKLAAPASKKSVRRGRPLDAAWDHATPVDAKRQRAVCKYCGFISSSGGITHLKAHLAGGDPKGPSKGCPNVPPEVKRAMAESLDRTVKGVKSMQPEEIRTYMKAENDCSPPRSDDYSLNQHRIVKNAQYSHLASGGNSVNDMTMSKQSETAHVDSYMEVMSSHNACKSSFLSKPTTRVGFI